MTEKASLSEREIKIALLNDMGFEAYDGGDSIDGSWPSWVWTLMESLYDAGWRKP